jgi:hypothetical protein
MRSCRFALVLFILAMFVSPAAVAGLADPPPTLGGQPSFHLWSVPGVINNGLGTVFLCTNATANPIRVGVEVFAPAGGGSLNDASSTSVLVQGGATVGWQTQSVASLFYLNNLGLVVIHNGSARVLATSSTGIICTAALAEARGNPPTVLMNLTIRSPNAPATAASSSAYGATALAGLLLATGVAMVMRRRAIA